MIEVHFVISTFGKKDVCRRCQRERCRLPKPDQTVRDSDWQEIIIGFMLSQDCGELSGVIHTCLDRQTQSGSLP